MQKVGWLYIWWRRPFIFSSIIQTLRETTTSDVRVELEPPGRYLCTYDKYNKVFSMVV